MKTILLALFVAAFAFLPAAAAGQQPAKEELRRQVEMLAWRFENAPSELEKKHAAASALQLAREDDLHVEDEDEMRLYLIAEATEVMSSEEPFPLAFDAEGRALSVLSQEFVAWATAAGLDPEVAAWNALRDKPVEISRLIGDTDPAVLALFEEALDSQNYLVAIAAAWGLAVAENSASIEHIGAVAESSPSDVGRALADVLDQYSDPAAHARAEEIRQGF